MALGKVMVGEIVPQTQHELMLFGHGSRTELQTWAEKECLGFL